MYTSFCIFENTQCHLDVFGAIICDALYDDDDDDM